MNVGSIFTGVGGFDLGFEQAGMSIAWQVEQDPKCREVLSRHWPDIPCYAQMGNAVTVNVAKWLGERIVSCT